MGRLANLFLTLTLFVSSIGFAQIDNSKINKPVTGVAKKKTAPKTNQSVKSKPKAKPKAKTKPKAATTEPLYVPEVSHSQAKIPTANVQNTWVEFGKQLADGPNLVVHVKFNVKYMNGRDLRVVAYFYDANGNAIQDTNYAICSKYGTSGSSSYVAAGMNCNPNYEDSYWEDFQFFIPYGELHQVNYDPITLQYKICMWDNTASPNKQFYTGSLQSFTFDPRNTPYASINKVWVEYNQIINDKKQIKIHSDFNVIGKNNKTIKYQVWFFKTDGSAVLLDTSGNRVYGNYDLTVKYDSSHWGDVWKAVPNNDFLYATNNDDPDKTCEYWVVIRDEDGKTLGQIEHAGKVSIQR